jgi:hypothetical protein
MIVYAVRDRFTGGAGGHVFRSTNGGQSWSDVSGNLPDTPVNAIVLNPSKSVIYIGTDIGVYATSTGGASWARFASGLPNVRVVNLQFNAAQNLLAAATYGRGVWEILPASGPTRLIISVKLGASAASHFPLRGPAAIRLASVFSVAVTALDPFGNIATSYRGTVHFTISTPRGHVSTDYGFTTADNGVHTHTGAALICPDRPSATAARRTAPDVDRDLAFARFSELFFGFEIGDKEMFGQTGAGAGLRLGMR